MNFEAVEKVANAVLYEGYMLYPYRPSSTKNQQRWNFGTLYPQAFAQAQLPAEAFSLQAECLVEATAEARLSVRVRFLHLDPQQAKADTWVEGVERDSKIELSIAELLERSQTIEIRPGPLLGRLTLTAAARDRGLVRLTIQLANVTPVECATRKEAVLFAFSSAHLLLGVDAGRFVSMLDPPAAFATNVSECHNLGVFPVLVGSQGSFDRMLCSPIILYDYPQVAPESAGDFFDGTEMDEMLSLRVLTMTDQEKAEMKSADARSRDLLERTETLPAEHMMKLHGAIRGLRRVRQQEEQ